MLDRIRSKAMIPVLGWALLACSAGGRAEAPPRIDSGAILLPTGQTVSTAAIGKICALLRAALENPLAVRDALKSRIPAAAAGCEAPPSRPR